MASVSLMVLLVSSFWGSEGNKFSSLGYCKLPLGDGQLWCEKLVAAWGCEAPWHTKCPGVNHPVGAAHNQDTLEKTCHAECMHTMHKAGKEGNEGEEEPNRAARRAREDQEREKIKEVEIMAKKVMKRAEECKKSGELKKAKNLVTVAQAEVLLELNELGEETDPQELDAEKMAGKHAALEVAEHDFNAETDVVFSGVKINEKARKHYQESIATLGRECGDDAEADEVAKTEAETLKKAVKERKGEMTKFESERGMTTADYMENQCKEETMNLEFFVGRITADDHLHGGSAFLMEAYSGKLHQVSHQLEFHAKAAMVLHHESNDLAHHFVAHLNHQEDSRQAKAKGEELGSHLNHLKTSAIEKLHAVAKVTNLTEKQLAHLHQLDEKHHHVIHGETKEEMCSNHAKRQMKAAADSPLNSQGVQAYVDCLCKDKQPSLLCQAQHQEAIQDAAQKIGTKFAQATQKMDADLGALQSAAAVAASDFPPVDDSSSLALARRDDFNRSGWPIGPCSQPISCRICFNGAACVSAPFPGNGKDAFGELRTRINDAGNGPPCLSGSCEACIAVAPPAEPIQFVTAIGFAGDCRSGYNQLVSFHFGLSFSVCFGNLGEVLEWIGMECIELFSAKYHPYIGKMMPPSLSINLVVVHAAVEVSVPVHDLTQPVRNHCKRAQPPSGCRSPYFRFVFGPICQANPEWVCIQTFYNARGSGSLSLTLKAGFVWWWKTVYSKTWNF